MAVSDEKLMLLEQVTYMDKNVYTTLGLKYPDDQGEILNKIRELNENDISKLDNLKVQSDDITGAEWKDIIHAIKADNELSSYSCVDYNKEVGAFCFVNSDTNEAVVTFRGTLNAAEWKDNALSLTTADTPAQIAALNYVNQLTQYDSVSLVGHSKGGNKAQYCAILADQVNIDKCVSMDGEGFSIDFLEKYETQIAANGSKITDYSYKSDFVNILLNDVPGSKQVYCDGTATGIRNHFSNSMFELVQTGDGWHVVYSPTEQDKNMKLLHDFSCYLCNNMPESDRREVAEYLADILDMAVVQGKTDKIADYILKDPDCATLVAGYLVKYMEENHIEKKEIDALLKEYGLADVKIKGFSLSFIIDNAAGIAKSDNDHLDKYDVVEIAANVVLEKKFKEILKKLKKGYKQADKTVRENRKKKTKNIFEEHENILNDIRNSVIESAKIVVTPEQLKAQADEMDNLQVSFESLSEEIKKVIETANSSLSENMMNNMLKKSTYMTDSLKKISDLLYSGARAANTAATTYGSVDKELAKQIANL